MIEPHPGLPKRVNPDVRPLGQVGAYVEPFDHNLHCAEEGSLRLKFWIPGTKYKQPNHTLMDVSGHNWFVAVGGIYVSLFTYPLWGQLSTFGGARFSPEVHHTFFHVRRFVTLGVWEPQLGP